MQKIWSSKSKRSQPSIPESELGIVDEKALQDSQNPTDQVTESMDLLAQESNNSDTLLAQEVLPVNAPESVATEDNPKWFLQYLPKIIADNLIAPREWQLPTSLLVLAIGVGGLAIVTTLGIRYLTILDSPTNVFSCKSKIQGDWQTPFGKLTLSETSDLVSGKYEYVNFERGKVMGELTGETNNNVVSFKWQETSDQQVKSRGQGTLIFSEGCQEFYGSYGEEGKANSFTSWQGYRTK